MQQQTRNANTRPHDPQGSGADVSCYLLAVSDVAKNLPGADALIAWFGRWPSFHDAEILSLELNRHGPSRARLHTWVRSPEIDAQGSYKTDKHCTIAFLLEEISELEVNGFNSQNVISSLEISKQEGGYRLSFSPCYGLAGHLIAGSIRVEFEPGIPTESKNRSWP